MPFQYQYPQQPLQGLQYPDYSQQEQPQQQGIDPGTAMNVAQQFMGGGSGVATGSQAAGNVAASEGIGSAGTIGGGGWGGASGGGGSAVASAGPWAALAAIIAVNEYNAVKGGYRSEDKGEYAKDLLSGEVFHQDVEQRWLPKIGLEEGSKENKLASVFLNPLGMTADPEKSFKRIKDLF